MLSARLKGPKAGVGVLGEGEVSSVSPARGSNIADFKISKSHQNGEP